MTYEEFKRELLRNISLHEGCRGRKVHLLEKGTEDEEARTRMEDRGLYFADSETGLLERREKMVNGIPIYLMIKEEEV